MIRDFSTISELKSIREQKSRLSERENELSIPILDDLGLIPDLYKWFEDILTGMDFPPNLESVTQRKKFLFIILFLYCPSVLAGGRMPHGVRKSLEEVFSNISPSRISHNIEDVTFSYQIYKDFRKDVDYLYTEILNRLQRANQLKAGA